MVEVDRATGQVRLLRHVACDDAGTILNPLLVDGQVHGGLGAGIAQALYEEVRFDDDGNPLTTNFADYALISSAELPSFERVPFETPTFVNELGAKGIGESGTIGATPAVQNAVVDALAHLGVRHIDLPVHARAGLAGRCAPPTAPAERGGVPSASSPRAGSVLVMSSQHVRHATHVRGRSIARCSAFLVLVGVLAALAGCTGGDDSASSSRSSLPLAKEFQADPSTSATPTMPPTTTTTSPFAAPSPDPNVEGLTQELLASQAGGVPLSPTQARCVASGMLTKLGMDPLVRLGAQAPAGAPGQVDLNALNPGERQAFADALIGCIDLNQLIVDELGPALGLPQDSLGCVAKRLADDGTLTNVLRQVVIGGTDPAGADAALTSPMLAALDNCLTADQLRKLTVPR